MPCAPPPPVIISCDSISLPDSLKLCQGDTATIHPTLFGSDTGFTVSWFPISGLSSASIINPVLTATTSGWYHVTISSLIEGCARTDSIYVLITPFVVSHTHSDTSFCLPIGVVTLHAPPGFTSFLWSTGASTSSINVHDSGYYWVNATRPCAQFTDTFHIATQTVPSVSLGNDTLICESTDIILSSPMSMGSFLWSNGKTTNKDTVSTAGTYFLTVTSNGCSASDTINIAQMSPPSLNIGPDTTLCNGEQLTLTATSGVPFWSTGEHATETYVSTSGTYWASVTNKCGTASDSIHVTFVPCEIFFPSAFSPNDDGLNDIARVTGYLTLFRDFSLSIYNRWGQRVFYTQDLHQGWDSTFNGVKQDLGTFYYMIYYTLQGKRHMMKGDLTLVR